MTDADLRCSECGEPFVEDGPCPKCGLTSRLTARSPIPGEFLSTVEMQATLPIEVIRSYARELMRLARRLIDGHGEYQFGVAVIVAHMACEIGTAQAISEALDAKGAQYLRDWVMGSRDGYNLNNDRVRSLYTALTGDEVQRQHFWPKFKKSAELRNHIIHRGQIATDAEAEASYNACNDLLEHLIGRMGHEVTSIR